MKIAIFVMANDNLKVAYHNRQILLEIIFKLHKEET